jgi:hypothetical protein
MLIALDSLHLLLISNKSKYSDNVLVTEDVCVWRFMGKRNYNKHKSQTLKGSITNIQTWLFFLLHLF